MTDTPHIYAIVPADHVRRRKAGGYVVDLGTVDDLLRLVLAAASAPPGMGVRLADKKEGTE